MGIELAAGPRAVRERAAGQTRTKLIKLNYIFSINFITTGIFDQSPSTKIQSIERSTYLESFEPPSMVDLLGGSTTVHI
jgi:hypothetical protein